MTTLMGNHGTYYENGIPIMGNHNIVKGENCTVMGNHNTVYGARCNVMGNHNRVSRSCTVTGNFNTYLDDDSAGSQRSNIVVNSAIGSANGAGNIVIDSASVYDSAIGFANRGTGYFNNFNCTIGRQDFDLDGGRTLILRNIRAESHILRGSTSIIKLLDGHELEYKDRSFTHDGKPVPIDFLFSMHNVTHSLTLEFAEFLDFLENLSGQDLAQSQLEGADEETEDESRACVICLTKVKCCAILPCAHMCLCIGCSKKVTQTCPICRQAVQTVKRIFG